MFKRFCYWIQIKFSPATIGGVLRAFVLFVLLLAVTLIAIKWYSPIDAHALESVKSITTPFILIAFFYFLAAIRHGCIYLIKGRGATSE